MTLWALGCLLQAGLGTSVLLLSLAVLALTVFILLALLYGGILLCSLVLAARLIILEIRGESEIPPCVSWITILLGVIIGGAGSYTFWKAAGSFNEVLTNLPPVLLQFPPKRKNHEK